MSIYTIGYQYLTPQDVGQILDGLGAVLIDCRYQPTSRKPGFHRSTLQGAFGARYIPAGHFLGGRGHTTAEGLAWLAEQAQKRPVILMCLEEAPGECHRHHDICAEHFPQAVHIYQDELVTAGELKRSMTEDDDYQVAGALGELLRQPA